MHNSNSPLLLQEEETANDHVDAMNNGGPLESQLESEDEDVAFGPNDVLSGRTKLSFNHIGNRRFREVVGRSVDDYNSANSRAEKYGIVETIVEEIAKSGGRFLKADKDGSWMELEPEVVRQKIAHAIRDTTKKKEAKKSKASQSDESISSGASVAAGPIKAPPKVPSAPASASHPESNSISSLVQGLNHYRREMMLRAGGTFPITFAAQDDNAMMAHIASMMNHQQHKRSLGSIQEGQGMMQPAAKITRHEPFRPGSDIAAKSLTRHSVGPCMGLGMGQHDSMRAESRYNLRQEEGHGVGLWEPGPLTPGYNCIWSGIQEEVPEGERRLTSWVPPAGRRHTMPTPIFGNNSDARSASSLGAQVTFDSSSSFDLVAELPHGFNEGSPSHNEERSLAHAADDDFLSRINQLPGLSDADPHFPPSGPLG